MITLEYIYDKFNGELNIYKKGEWVPLTKGYCKEFDLDLKFGKMGEEFVQGVLEGNSKIEIKLDDTKIDINDIVTTDDSVRIDRLGEWEIGMSGWEEGEDCLSELFIDTGEF